MDEAPDDSAETQRLLEEGRAGNSAAFDKLFARHRPFLRQVIDVRLDDRLRARVDPSDIVQETQLEAFRRLDDYLQRRPMPFRLWLRQTACERVQMAQRRHVRAKRRSVQREVQLPDNSSLLLAEQLLARNSSVSRQLSRREMVQLVRHAMTQLSDADREILMMRNLEMLSNQEAAQALAIDPGAASQRYGRALLRLRRLLIDHDAKESDR